MRKRAAPTGYGRARAGIVRGIASLLSLQATIDGAGSFTHRIKVKNLGKPGKAGDTYEILLADLYISGGDRKMAAHRAAPHL